ncbi:uncharacterized protein LOC127844242 [Dreissena polymorpha]|uniref:uncharacterized protein LOC127844242 n=1 Tax=Dreissena polymorpha TaxID=45954 RepID=UPI002263E056|nr:uncharacterized protein LOC127844242 [Dreissena polymorpha]
MKLKDVLHAKQKQLKREGLGNKPQRADSITYNEIDELWNTNQLGQSTPESIINSLWFFNTIHFGLRGSDEHRSLCWGDLKLCTDDEGNEYLEFEERQSKTRQGGNPRDVRDVKPKMWANEIVGEKCPVAIYKEYTSRRPADYCKPSDPFYIATHTMQSNIKPSDQWFKRQPIEQNKLTSIMKRMAKAAGLPEDKRLTNHSARKHLVQKLSENKVPPNHIMQITDHRNLHPINNYNTYSHISEQQHNIISNILANTSNPQQMPFPYQLNQMSVTRNTMNFAAHASQYTFNGGLNNMFAGSIFGGTSTLILLRATNANRHIQVVRGRKHTKNAAE